MRDFKYVIRDLMSYYRLSQADIVTRTGICKSTLSNYVSGKRVPKQDTIQLLANTYGVNISWLLGIENAPMFLTEEDPKIEYNSQDNSRIEIESKEHNLENILMKYLNLSPGDKEIINNMIDSLSKRG